VRNTIITRILVSLIIGIVISGLVSELSFRLLKNTTSRPPKTIELVIPAGTAQKVAQGESVIPGNMTFVVGDTLLVKNEDQVAHTLGPLYIPAGSSANLTLNQPENLAYTCSFQPTRYIGLDVQEALTLTTRIKGILLAGVPMGILLGLYSLVAWPLKPKNA